MVLLVVKNVLINSIVLCKGCSKNGTSACERDLTKPVVHKGFINLLQQIQNLKESTSSDDSDSNGGLSGNTLPNVNLL